MLDNIENIQTDDILCERCDLGEAEGEMHFAFCCLYGEESRLCILNEAFAQTP